MEKEPWHCCSTVVVVVVVEEERGRWRLRMLVEELWKGNLNGMGKESKNRHKVRGNTALEWW